MAQVFCSECGKKTQVKDELAGKRVKCPGCGELLKVPVATTNGTAAKVPAKAAATATVRKAKAVKAAADEDEDEDEDEKPSPRKGKKKRRFKEAKDSGKPVLMIVISLVVVLLIAGGGIGAYFAFRTPKEKTSSTKNPDNSSPTEKGTDDKHGFTADQLQGPWMKLAKEGRASGQIWEFTRELQKDVLYVYQKDDIKNHAPEHRYTYTLTDSTTLEFTNSKSETIVSKLEVVSSAHLKLTPPLPGTDTEPTIMLKRYTDTEETAKAPKTGDSTPTPTPSQDTKPPMPTGNQQSDLIVGDWVVKGAGKEWHFTADKLEVAAFKGSYTWTEPQKIITITPEDPQHGDANVVGTWHVEIGKNTLRLWRPDQSRDKALVLNRKGTKGDDDPNPPNQPHNPTPPPRDQAAEREAENKLNQAEQKLREMQTAQKPQARQQHLNEAKNILNDIIQRWPNTPAGQRALQIRSGLP